MFSIRSMDHIVLNVRDMDLILDFYMNVLGLPGERIEEFHKGEVPFPSVRINADTIIDLFPISTSATEGAVNDTAVLNHFCLVIDKTDMSNVIEHLEQHGVKIDQGPVTRWGAHGSGTSIYFNDPENRQMEIRYYES